MQFLVFAIDPALLQSLDLLLIRQGQGNGQSLRKEEITGVTRGYFHMVRFGPEADHIVSQNNFCLWHDKYSFKNSVGSRCLKRHIIFFRRHASGIRITRGWRTLLRARRTGRRGCAGAAAEITATLASAA